MEFVGEILDFILHLDVHLNAWAGDLGGWLYLVLFLILFCETGLVVTPILPGDSLLFAVGALAAIEGSPLDLPFLLGLLIAAAVIGDAVNYLAGYYIGPRVFKSEESWLFNKNHLLRTQHFYDKHGGKTIVLARFIPIIRTFAPFVAGIGKMTYRKFSFYNVTGGVAWVCAFLLGGYFLGNVPTVKRNFHIIIVAILIISVLPVVIEFYLARRRRSPAESLAPPPNTEPVPVESK
jgi:membrane-associated protein